MKHTKRWVSLLLAVMMTVAAPLSAFAAWEDGFVIPGQNSGSNSYDDLFWDTINKSNSTIISSTTEDKKKEDTTEKRIPAVKNPMKNSRCSAVGYKDIFSRIQIFCCPFTGR